jgi:hypothetical protein
MSSWSPSIETLNLLAALFHGAQAIAALGITFWLNNRALPPERALFDGGRVPVYRVVTLWPTNSTLTRTLVNYSTLDLRALIVAFFVLSAVCQGAASLLRKGRSGAWRYVEYSVSAAVMILALAAEAGIGDLYTLVTMFVLTWITMLLGVGAEYVQTRETPWLWLAPHLAGWVTCIAAYAPIIDNFLLNCEHSEPRSPPGFVRVIVFLEFALFTSFGLAQAWGLTLKAWAYNDTPADAAPLIAPNYYYVPPQSYYPPTITNIDAARLTYTTVKKASLDDRIEVVFITLSFTAKTLLCWLILSPLLMAERV